MKVSRASDSTIDAHKEEILGYNRKFSILKTINEDKSYRDSRYFPNS